jgi:multiple sugar transport system substrate-binding protein
MARWRRRGLDILTKGGTAMRTFSVSRSPRLVVAATLALVVAACGSGAPSATSAPSPSAAAPSAAAAGSAAPGASASAPASAAATTSAAACGTYAGPPVTITYAMWGDTTELANQQKIVDAFTKLNPSITVKVSVADWDSYWPKLQVDLAAGNAPDVFLMDGPLYPDYQTRDQLLDLSSYIARDGFDTSQLVDLAVQDFKAADGHLYGLPRDLNTIALFYNKTMFDAAGLPYPDATWDWNKLVEVATKLTKSSNGKTSQWGFYTETSDMENYWSSLVWQAGGDILSADKKTVVINSDQATAGIQFLQDLIYKDKVMAQPVAGGSGDLFENGQAAMEANGSWLVPTHEAAGLSFGVAPLPKGPAGQATSVNPSGVVAYKGSKSPDAAWEFIKCYTGPQLQAMIASLKASMPANKEVLTGQYAASFEGGKTFADALAYAHLKPSFAGYNEFTSALQDELDTKVFNDKTLTAKAALSEVTPALQKLLGK